MRVYTAMQEFKLIPNVIETLYVDNVPYSAQQKLKISRNLVIENVSGQRYVRSGLYKSLTAKQSEHVIKVLNGMIKDSSINSYANTVSIKNSDRAKAIKYPKGYNFSKANGNR